MDGFDTFYPATISLSELREIVAKEFVIRKEYLSIATYIPTFIIERIEDPPKLNKAFNNIQKQVEQKNMFPLMRKIARSNREIPDEEIEKYLYLRFLPAKKRGPSRKWINITLFAITCVTIFSTSFYFLWLDPLYFPGFIYKISGILFLFGYFFAVIGIIGLHELGHLFAARRHKIKSSWPYFIPFIPPLGTMGAVIIQKTPPKNKNELFDLGLSGPIAGFIIALIVSIIGYLLSTSFLKMEYINALAYNSWIEVINATPSMPDPAISYIFNFLFFQAPHQVSPTALNLIAFNSSSLYVIVLHTTTFAGWIGFFVTGLNLMPLAQLDGGHIMRAVLGSKYYKFASYIALVVLFIINPIFAFLVLALSRFRLAHPGPLNDVTPLSRSRKIISILFFVILILTIPIGSFFFNFF